MQGSLLPSRSREKMRCADFRVFSLRVQGPQPLPKEVQNPRWVPHLAATHRSFDGQLRLREFLRFEIPGERRGAREFAGPNRHHDVNDTGIVGLGWIE